ncbi:hypothetical protein FNH05_32795 [Amycolatopsis rhizosphaerae]|uniref:DUF5709 domain-containing protein n=1 Tax=Amycolatopsis rhizosphaerae TaxID=2053003 RepID=A0A558AHN1_9PSEU|nr:hypothetical protein [Amycolatopsis rhizosphaerae]TVT23792.1 hypothetical protein FNH05_32795 [Amycolatopsis rhizosphaerae]
MTHPDESLREALDEDGTLPVDPLQPVPDVLEQRQEIAAEVPTGIRPGLPAEADPGDVAEQQRGLGYPEDQLDEEEHDHG